MLEGSMVTLIALVKTKTMLLTLDVTTDMMTMTVIDCSSGHRGHKYQR